MENNKSFLIKTEFAIRAIYDILFYQFIMQNRKTTKQQNTKV